MPQEVQNLLKGVRVRNQPLQLESEGPADDFVPGAPRPRRPGRGGPSGGKHQRGRSDGRGERRHSRGPKPRS